MPAAEQAFSSLCGDVTYSEYCSAPWQYTGSTCCGICPSPAINAYGTLAGLTLASFFNLLTVLFQPERSAMYIAVQLLIGHMYLVAVMVRNIMGSASNGTNGLQKWHAEFAFLLASSITSIIFASVLSDTHHIHGFSSASDFNDYLDSTRSLTVSQLTTTSESRQHGSHLLHRQERDEFQPGGGVRGAGKNGYRSLQRFRKWAHRSQAKILFFSFAGTELYWFIMYAATIWFPSSTIFWQPHCDDLIGTANFTILTAVSWTFTSLAFLATLFLYYPAFYSPKSRSTIAALNRRKERIKHQQQQHPEEEGKTVPPVRVRSVAQLLVRLFHTHSVKKRGKQNVEDTAESETPAERRIKIVISFIVWIFWFTSGFVIIVKALNDFLLTSSVTWPFAGIQNFMFGCFPMFNFFLGAVRAKRRAAYKKRKASKAGLPVPTKAQGQEKKKIEPHRGRPGRRKAAPALASRYGG
ncbi:hypothetical protein JCM8547_000156 [Rhodosporidiobolus lusitaniae]